MIVRGIWKVNTINYDDDDKLSDICVESNKDSKLEDEEYSDLEMFEKDRADEEKRNQVKAIQSRARQYFENMISDIRMVAQVPV